jgi:ADP-ribosylglycohydrolase
MIGAEDFLRCVRFGDWVCSGAKHRLKGKRKKFNEILKMATGYSDDYTESKAIYDMRNIPIPEKPSISDLEHLKDKFCLHLKDHFLGHKEVYGRTLPEIFKSKGSEYLELIIKHSTCGAAMRAPVLGFIGAGNHRLFCLSAMTHLHPEAVAGAFAVVYSVNALKRSKSFIDYALRGSDIGEGLAEDYLSSVGKGVEYAHLPEIIEKVLSTNEPYSSIKDVKKEGIETRFVVPASFLVVRDALSLDNPESALRYLVEKSFEIGGDPDTICSISTGLASIYYKEKLLEKIDAFWKVYQ